MTFTQGTPKPATSGIKKGQKQHKTLLKEERRAMFDAEISKVFFQRIKDAKAEYVLDQFIGKAPDESKVVVEVKKYVKLDVE